MSKITDTLVKEIQALQDFIDWRTDQEQEAIDLISSGHPDLALDVLSRLDKLTLDDFMSGDNE